jgi:asparagine synthase (glutamine-hydrolysing)
MCGIAGVFDTRPGARPGTDIVRPMLAVIAHRGPDDSGIHDGGPLVMGARRLKVIDLDGGHQPMASEDGSITVVYNGEIYNHARLRTALEARGHVFRSRCDTEVVVHAWEEFGEACLERFEGMFGFALWDRRAGGLWLVRDRLGVKPLYYAWDGTRLVFGSEIKAILASGAVAAEVDLQSLYHYVGYEFVPAPATMFRGISKIPAGHLLKVTQEGPSLRQYWDVRIDQADLSEAAFISGIRERLTAAVAKRLVSDVPLGVFLSGGLDSTAVLALAREATDAPIPTFTIGYRDPGFSEWDHARRAARYYGTDHHEIVMDPVAPADIEQTVWHFDEPMTDLSAIPFYVLSRQARTHVTVCLSGEGGDEVFAGYDRFIASKLYHRAYRFLPGVVRQRMIEPVVGRLADREQKKGAVNMLRRFVEGAALPDEAGHMRWQFFSSAGQERALFRPAFLARVRPDPFEPLRRGRAPRTGFDRLAGECYVDLRVTMPESVLMKVDKMSMAHALEVRVPFLDHDLVQFAAGIPGHMKLRGLRTKAIYRKAMRSVLPAFVLERGKQGYSAPIKHWLRADLRDFLVSTLSGSPLINEHFDPGHIRVLLEQHAARSHNHNHVLWALLNVALWHRRFIEQAAVRAA